MDYDWARWRQTAEGIGWIAIQAARLEFTLAVLEINLVGSDLAYAIVGGQNWSAMKDGCIALLDERIGRGPYIHHGPEVTADLEKIVGYVKAADRLMTNRNHVVHALWSDPDAAGAQEAHLVQRWNRGRGADWTAEELQQLHRDLNQAAKDLDASAVYIREQNEQRLADEFG